MILDLGCGPGKPMAAYLLARGFDICGVDSSPTMISLARSNFPDREWIIADMRALSLGRTFDGVMAWDSFFHLNFDDQRRMFPVFRTHAKPKAPLLLTSGPQHGEAVGSFRGEPLYHASLSPDEYRALFAENGFECMAERMEDPECGSNSVWLARRVENG
jgi:SAM-dependent methyltransferase